MKQPPGEPAPVASWRRPRGVASGTWEYTHQRSIADHYDAFVADTPLCQLDLALLRDVFPSVNLNSPETVLDLGSGTGRATMELSRRGYRVIAIDLSQSMLQNLVRKAESLHPSRQPYAVRANLVDLQCLADQSADHAICLFSTLGMIQGRPHRLAMLRHVARIVRPGGTFLLHVHNRWSALREPNGLLSLARSWWNSKRNTASDFGDAVYRYRGLENMFMHRFSRRELLWDLDHSGWVLRKLHRVSIDGATVDSSLRIPGGFIADCRRG